MGERHYRNITKKILLPPFRNYTFQCSSKDTRKHCLLVEHEHVNHIHLIFKILFYNTHYVSFYNIIIYYFPIREKKKFSKFSFTKPKRILKQTFQNLPILNSPRHFLYNTKSSNFKLKLLPTYHDRRFVSLLKRNLSLLSLSKKKERKEKKERRKRKRNTVKRPKRTKVTSETVKRGSA